MLWGGVVGCVCGWRWCGAWVRACVRAGGRVLRTSGVNEQAALKACALSWRVRTLSAGSMPRQVGTTWQLRAVYMCSLRSYVFYATFRVRFARHRRRSTIASPYPRIRFAQRRLSCAGMPMLAAALPAVAFCSRGLQLYCLCLALAAVRRGWPRRVPLFAGGRLPSARRAGSVIAASTRRVRALLR